MHKQKICYIFVCRRLNKNLIFLCQNLKAIHMNLDYSLNKSDKIPVQFKLKQKHHRSDRRMTTKQQIQAAK